MKIIDLLNKIANGEELPKYIKYYDKLHSKEDIMLCCYTNLIYKLDNVMIDLNDEVEILDDKDEEKESLYKPYALFGLEYTDDLHEIIKKSNINFKNISEKVNEIIYYLEKQRKGE